MLHDVDHREIFECAHLKFMVSGRSKQASKQASIDTHMRAQCSHASVGLAQVRPNYPLSQCTVKGLVSKSLSHVSFSFKLESDGHQEEYYIPKNLQGRLSLKCQ